MNMVDFQEKMDPTHRMYLCRMLNVKELPEDLLARYAKVKRMIDRIDGHLTAGDLAMIIISVGVYRADDGKIYTNSIPAAVIDVQDAADELPVKPTLDESGDKVIEEAVEPPVEQPVSGATGQGATAKATEKPTPKEGGLKLWSPGMPVRVLQEDELKQGKIFAVHPGDGEVQLTVEFEGGETVMVNESEVEAI